VFLLTLLLLSLPRPARAAVEQVIVVFKTHFDIGYTDMASNVVQRYRTRSIDQALEVVDAKPQPAAGNNSLSGPSRLAAGQDP